jgi:hypothetical protein|tara:strand:- start:446 stop:1234 length:789 start_codon:yes stop_codon:yes gene_type:complete
MEKTKANGAVTAKTDKLPAMNMENLEKFAGTGLDTITTDDIATPRLKVLAQMSPELEEIDGAKAGMICNSVSKKIYSGQDGISVVVCGYDKVWLEWQDRGKGSSAPVNIFSPVDKPTNAVRGDDGKFRLESGNYLEECANFYCLLLNGGVAPEPAIISMKATQLKAARSWAYSLKNEFIQNPKTKKLFLAPSWYRMYTLTTTKQSNDKGSWYGWVVNKGDFLNSEDTFDMAANFNESVRKGIVKPKYDDEVDSSSSDQDTPF